MHEAVIACAEIVRKGDPDRFRATMAAPVVAREKLFPIYAFNVEVARAPWVTAEAMIAEMRLQWWRDVLDEVSSGSAVRQHEVATPLAEVIAPEEAALLDDLVVARRWDIYRDPFEGEAEFRDHLSKTSANLLLVAARALGRAPEQTVRAAGQALGIANWLRAIPALERAGRVPLVDGTPAAVKALAEEGLDLLSTARAGRRDVPREVQPALLTLWEAGAVLRAARATPSRVAEGTLTPAPIQSRARLMWQALTGRWWR